MKQAKIIRNTDTGKETLGDFYLYDDTGTEIFKCKTLERTWLNNQHGISCIPEGLFPEVVWSHMITANKDHYQIMNVPDRDAIFFHGGNKFMDSHGCILLGYSLKDFDLDGNLDLIDSGNAIKTFEYLMNKESFKLEIVQAYSLS